MSPRRILAALVVSLLLAISTDSRAEEGAIKAKAPDPLTPDQALARFALADGYKMQLVASEPTIGSPVAARFDEDGHLWVVEMRDYPDGWPDGPPPRSRILRLDDRDEDGFYETAQVFADKLLFATGVQPWKGGLIVTVAGKVMYMKDTDNDGRADLQETWFSNFSEENPQHRVNHPRFAMDNRMYIAVGAPRSTADQVRTPGAKPLALQGRDLRFDPLSNMAEAIAGPAQFGLTFDDFGNRFEVSNRNPLYHLVFDERYLSRNPLLTLPSLKQDVVAAGDASHVFPLGQTWTTSILHAGQFTAACGVDIYRGDAMPAMYGNSFTCEPTGNLVHREILSPSGATFVGKPAYEGKDFLASDDSWFRPVNTEEGPDGALYVVDMYRAVIEHPQYMKDELKHLPDLRLGDNKGRVWRITSAEPKRGAKPNLSQALTAELVKLLSHPSAWWRDTAARLIYERQDRSIGPALSELATSSDKPFARVQALWSLNGLGLIDESKLLTALTDTSPRVREQAIVLAEPLAQRSVGFQMAVRNLSRDGDPALRFQVALSLGGSELDGTTEALASIALAGCSDIWTRRAIATATPENVGKVLEVLLRELAAKRSSPDGDQLALVEELARISGAREDSGPLVALLDIIGPDRSSEVPERLALTLINGLSQGTRSRGKTLADVVGSLSKGSAESRTAVEYWFERSATIAADASRDESARKEACDILGYAPYDLAAPTLTKLFADEPSQDVRRKALAALASQRDARVGAVLIEQLPTATPAMRSAIFEALLSDVARINLLLDEVDTGKVRVGELGALRANRILKHRNKEIRERAAKLLASAIPADRTKALADYEPALGLASDAARGKETFKKNCSTCHRIGDVGVDVGPSIADSRTKTPEQLLVDILLPSKAIDTNYASYSVTTKDGQGFTGIIIAETTASVTLKMPEAKTVSLLRSDIEELRPNGISLMPDGLEKNISKQEMADVIAFVKTWRYLDSKAPSAPGQ